MTLGARIHAVVVRDLVAKRARRNAPNHHVRWLVALRVAEERNHERVQRQQAACVSGWWNGTQTNTQQATAHPTATLHSHTVSHIYGTRVV